MVAVSVGGNGRPGTLVAVRGSAARLGCIDQLIASFLANEHGMSRGFYMTPGQLRILTDLGTIIGSHTLNHPVMSKLSNRDQE